MMMKTLRKFLRGIYIIAIMINAPNGLNFINFGGCCDWCYGDLSISDSSNMLVVGSLNPLCTHIHAVTKQRAQTIIDNLLPLQLLNIDQLIIRMTRDSKLTGYASTIPVLLQDKTKTGTLAAPKVQHPYQEVLCQIFDTKLLVYYEAMMLYHLVMVFQQVMVQVFTVNYW